MITFIKDLLLGDLVEKFVGLIIIISSLTCIGLLVYIVDSAGLKPVEQQVSVISKHYEPAWTQYQTQMVNNVPITQTIYYPEGWYVIVGTNNFEELTCLIDKQTYHKANSGDTLTALISFGRLTNNTYCKGAY